jgi:hypothetical protein
MLVMVEDAAREGNGKAALGDYLAAERTFLAWIRTGLALMGFGFIVARFGLFLMEFQLAQGSAGVQSHRFSLWYWNRADRRRHRCESIFGVEPRPPGCRTEPRRDGSSAFSETGRNCRGVSRSGRLGNGDLSHFDP